MESARLLTGSAVLASVSLIITPAAFAADVTGDRANIGASHLLTGSYATITGGSSNTNKSTHSVIAGGFANMIETI